MCVCGRVVRRLEEAAREHVDDILALEFVKVDEVQQRKLTVCLDSVNGTC